MKIALALAISLAASLAMPVEAKPAPKASAAKPKPAPKTDPIDELINAVYANQLGRGKGVWDTCLRSNPKALAFAMRDAVPLLSKPRSEFESTAEYEARQQKLERLINMDHPIVFCTYLDDNEDAPFAYDADTEVFTGSFRTQFREELDFKKTGTYTSKTKMGVSATVESFLGINYMVEMSDTLKSSSSDCLKVSYGSAIYRVGVPRAFAPKVKKDAYFVLVGRIVAPYFTESTVEGNPTLDHPKDITDVYFKIHFQPTDVAIVMPDDTEVMRCKVG